MEDNQSWSEEKAKSVAWFMLGVVGVATVTFLIAIITNLSLDYDFEKFFPQNDEETNIFLEHREMFGTDNDFVLIGIENKSGVFNREFMLCVDSLASDLRELNYIDSVVTPLSLMVAEQEIGGNPANMNFFPLLDCSSDESLRKDSAMVLTDERYLNTFFSGTKPAISIFIRTESYLSKDKCDYIAEELPKVVNRYRFDEVHYAGRSVGQSYYIELMQTDLMTFISASIVLLILFLILAYRTVWGVMVPMTVVMLSNIWILGIMAVIGEPVNMILTVLPTIIFVVGMSDVVHIVSKYLEELRLGKSKMAALRIAFKEIGLATLLTSVTTAIGFITLLTSTVGPIRIFGLYTAIGVMVAYTLAFTVLPSILVLMKKPEKLTVRNDIWKPILRRSFILVINNPGKVLLISAVLIGMCIWGASRIEQNNYLLEDLRSRNEMKQHFMFFEDAFAGVRPLEIQVRVKDPTKSVLDYEVMQEMNKLDQYLRTEYGAGSLMSPLVMVKTMNSAAWGGMPEKYTFPSKEDYSSLKRGMNTLVNRYKKDVKEGKADEQDFIGQYLDTSLKVVRFTGRVGDLGSKKFNELNSELEAYYQEEIDTSLIDYSLTGTAHLIDKNNGMLASSMMKGLLIAFVLVGFLMGLLFKSFKMLLISLVPNIIPLLVIAGLLGLAGEDLKVSVSIIFTIAFGIAVDDTIHFMSKIKIERMKGRTMLYALKRAYLSTGRAIIITTLILCAGFLMLVFSDFLGTFYIGYLISVTLFIAVLADLFVLPALLIVLEKKTKKIPIS